MENLKLKTPWTVWENIALSTQKDQSEESWKKSIVKVVTVSDLNSFASMWNKLPYHKPSQTFFFDKSRMLTKKFQIKDRDDLQQINAINIFRNEIMPSYEDPANRNGGFYRIEIGDTPAEETDKAWQDLILALIGETFKLSDQVNGIRVVDRSKPPAFTVRVEIWVKYNKNAERQVSQDFEKSLAEHLSSSGVTRMRGFDENDALRYRLFNN